MTMAILLGRCNAIRLGLLVVVVLPLRCRCRRLLRLLCLCSHLPSLQTANTALPPAQLHFCWFPPPALPSTVDMGHTTFKA